MLIIIILLVFILYFMKIFGFFNFFCCPISKKGMTSLFVEPGFIKHETVKDLLGLTMLVYDYSKKFTLEEDETIETFVSGLKSNKEEMKSLEFSDERSIVLNQLNERSPQGKVVTFISDEETDIQVGVTTSEINKRISVIFRGSESKADWYYDLMIFKTKILDNKYENVQVHSGFHTQLHKNNVYEKLINVVKKLKTKHPDYNIYITGHSLGAALSTLFGFELANEIDNKVTVVSFASPRIGNPEFRTAFDKKDNLEHYRVSNDRDIVTAGPMINFQHVGTNIALSDDKCEIFKLYDYNTWFKFSLFNCWKVSDHNVDLYYTRLCKFHWNEKK